MRCSCGTLLAGVDLTLQEEQTPPIPVSEPVQLAANSDQTITCPYADCGQPNPPESVDCRYCDRPLHATASPVKQGSLFNLPSALSHRYRISEAMPAKGAEAELLLVQAIAGGEQRVAKIYRHGILPKAAVQERISRVGRQHRVDILEHGVSDGYAYELMEYCTGGSLRTLLLQPDHSRGLPPELVRTVAKELALALADIHANGLVHRDLKPENILIRQLEPLDLVLTDFGIASVLDATQRYTGVAHTMPYASPESLSGVIDAKADYWALGMILLEAATGQHPFSNLSDAVILHYLTTQNIVTSGIEDALIAKLTRGLLIRDPRSRWGAKEIQRWLANDNTLAEPLQGTDPVPNYSQPYHLGDQRCYQPEQLGVALARHWELGVTDLANNQLLAWFRDVQKDQNVVRLMLQWRSDTTLSVDVQLLTLILYLAPGIPPNWHGQSISLSAILAQASAAISGDDKAARWLNELYQYRVLEIYAKAGNQAAADIVERWNKTCDQFITTWESKNDLIHEKVSGHKQDEPVDIDKLMYGNHRLNRPYLATLHARILAFCYDSRWAERKRQSVAAELTGLTVQCPWFVELGDPHTMNRVELLVMECLLPEARDIAAKQTRKEAQTIIRQQQEHESKSRQISGIISQLRTLIIRSDINAADCDNLLALCNDFFSAVTELRSSGRTDPPWIELRKSALRHESTVRNLVQTIYQLTEHNAVNAGWFNRQTVGYFLFTLFVLFFPAKYSHAALLQPGSPLMVLTCLACAAFIAWRLVPIVIWKRQIKGVADRLSSAARNGLPVAPASTS